MALAVAVATTGGRASDVCAVYIYYICTIEAKKRKERKELGAGRTRPYWQLSSIHNAIDGCPNV